MKPEDLRRAADEAFSGHQPALCGDASDAEVKALIHELGVHQIELEMQNQELHRAQADLEASRQRYFDLFDLAPVGYLTLSVEGVVLETNLTCARLLGVAPADLVGQPLARYVAREDRDREYLSRNRLVSLGLPEELEVRMAPRGLPEFWARWIGTRAVEAGVTVCRVALFDVSAQKRAEASLQEEKDLLALTLNGITDAVVTLDTSHCVRAMNGAAESLTGWTTVEALGLPFQTILPIPGFGTAAYLRTPITTATRSGQDRLVTGSLSPILGTGAIVLGTVVVFRDVTERQKLADTLQRSDKLDALGVLAGGIAHDFNNLLGGIFGYLSLARDVGHPDAVTLKYLDKAVGVFQRAKALTLQLLTFSSGGGPQRTLGRVGDVIAKTAEFALSGSNVSVELSVDPELWGCEFDEHQIEQVLDNLVINARQSMPAGGVIRISGRNVTFAVGQKPPLDEGAYLEVTVADEGTGVPVGLRDKIFDPFFTTKTDGHGLGLATCHSIVLKHGGLLELDPTGTGATFRFFLPALDQGACHDPEPLAAVHRGTGTVLILDDEAYLREVLSAQLHQLGYDVLEAAEGAQALTLARGCSDLSAVILDLTIRGGLGGLEILTSLRQSFPQLPVFASSGYSDDPVMARPTEFGFTDSLAKPYQPADLAALLEHYLQGP